MSQTPSKGPVPEVDDGTAPTVVLIIGMAGTGKSTVTHRLNLHCQQRSVPAYFINLDPAVLEVPYGVNIDIRDTVHYQEVMRTHQLGPNGAILTSLNLFVTQIDEVMQFLEEHRRDVKYVFVDTPGQIEVFTWSASGAMITQVMSATFPTVILYVLDGIRCASNPQCFMSGVLYATSIMYKTNLPLLMVFNKADACDAARLFQWMKDPKSFEDALRAHANNYASSLSQTMSLMLSSFYEAMKCVAVSAATGSGFPEMLESLQGCRQEYYVEFVPTKLVPVAQKEKEMHEHLQRLRIDMGSD